MLNKIKVALVAAMAAVLTLFGAGPAMAGSYNLAVYCAYPGTHTLALQYDGDQVYVDACTNEWGISAFYVRQDKRTQYRTGGVVYWTSCSWTVNKGFYFNMNANTALLTDEYC